MAAPVVQYKVGESVLANGKTATVRFIGPTKFAAGTWRVCVYITFCVLVKIGTQYEQNTWPNMSKIFKSFQDYFSSSFFF